MRIYSRRATRVEGISACRFTRVLRLAAVVLKMSKQASHHFALNEKSAESRAFERMY